MITDLPVTLVIDQAWWPLGRPDLPREEVADILIDRQVDPEKVPVDARQNLRNGLLAVMNVAGRLPAGQRRSYALVRDAARGRVDALLSVRFSQAGEGSYAEYLAQANEQSSTDTVELINQRVIESTTPAGRLIVVHGFTVAVASEGIRHPALERCTAALFVEGQPALIELLIVTQDLALFDDLVVFASALISGEDPGVPGFLEWKETS